MANPKLLANPVDRTASDDRDEDEDENNPFLFQSFVQRKSGYEGYEDDDIFVETSSESGRTTSFYQGVPVIHRDRSKSQLDHHHHDHQPRDIKIINGEVVCL